MYHSTDAEVKALRVSALALIQKMGFREAAKKCRVSALSLVIFAHGHSKPQARTVRALRKALRS
jgi:hypothetical protein